MDVNGLLERLQGKRILVLGDLMLDRYWWGSVTRISPEAPVPVVSLERESTHLGGAANVAANLKGLGAEPVLCGLVGRDDAGHTLRRRLDEAGIAVDGIVDSEERPTTVKTRIVAHQQQIVRLDEEDVSPLSLEVAESLMEVAVRAMDRCDVVLMSDYAKGVLAPSVVEAVLSAARSGDKKVIIDPKGKDYTKYTGAFLLTPNQKEAMEATGLSVAGRDELERAARHLADGLGLHAMLVTRGEHGMMLVETGETTFELPASAREVYDVTGAGDTVIATLTGALAAGLSLKDAARLANLAAGIVVEHVGTTAITKDMLLGES
jgi:D-beta-D-heptose 7-phosphate kinase/D-beta-D-heptose 1-phosphate adenosyltransferase